MSEHRARETKSAIHESEREARRSGLARSAVIAIAAGAMLLAAIPAVISFNAAPADTLELESKPTESEIVLIESILDHFAQGRVEEGANLYSGNVDPQRVGFEAYERILSALLAAQKREFTKAGLVLYGRVLTDIARYDVEYDDSLFRSHARRLRRQAISRGEAGNLYYAVIYRLMEFPELVDYCPPMRIDLLDYHVLFGDQTPKITGDDEEAISDRSHWDSALDQLPALIEQERTAPSPNLGERYHPLRSLARVHARNPTERSRQLFKSTLGRLGDGSAEDRERFDRWFARAVDNPDEEPWDAPADPSEYFGYDAEIAMQLRNWLVGVSRHYRQGDGLARGRLWIERALEGVDFGPHYLFKLDLALAIRDESNRLEAVLEDETSVSGRDRVRQLYEIGWQSLRRGDREELRSVLGRLEESSVPEVMHIRELLGGALQMLRGEKEGGTRRIADRLDGEYEALRPEEIDEWRNIADTGSLPIAANEEIGHSLLTSGVLWDDLREEKQLERIVIQLERNLSHANDHYYMQYLEAVLAYRRSTVDGLADRMQSLLDLAEPPGISRGDVAGLAAAIDSRVEDLNSIRERRRRALEDLIPAVLRGVPDRSSVIQLAEIVDWQIRMDQSQGRYIDSEEGRAGLRKIMAGMKTDGGLDFRIEEKWIELEAGLLGFTRSFRLEGELELARETLEYSNLLLVDHPKYRAEEAQILALEAERVPRAEPTLRAAAWLEVAEAYRDAASTQFGDPGFYFDAGEAFLTAGEFSSAKAMFEKYVPNRGEGARGERRYWWQKIYACEIARQAGLPARSLKVLDDITDFHGAETYRSRLALERAWALEDSGETEQALAIFEDVLLFLVDPLSEDYAHALYGKARVLQDRHGRIFADPSRTVEERSAVLEESHRVWENLCHKLPPQSGDVRLAEALYLCGVGWIERGDYQRAREYFEMVTPAYEYARTADLDPADLTLWRHFAVKSAHAHAEAFFLEGRFTEAIEMYQAAIAIDPESGEIALAYHQLGVSWFQLNDFQEAKRHWELGRSRVQSLDDERLGQLPVNQDKSFWLALYDEKLEALDNPDRLRSKR